MQASFHTLCTGWLLLITLWQEFTPGFIFWNFVFFEGVGRLIVDFYRDNALFVGLSLGQWFSVAMILVSLWFFWTKHQEDWKKVLLSKKN